MCHSDYDWWQNHYLMVSDAWHDVQHFHLTAFSCFTAKTYEHLKPKCLEKWSEQMETFCVGDIIDRTVSNSDGKLWIPFTTQFVFKNHRKSFAKIKISFMYLKIKWSLSWNFIRATNQIWPNDNHQIHHIFINDT